MPLINAEAMRPRERLEKTKCIASWGDSGFLGPTIQGQRRRLLEGNRSRRTKPNQGRNQEEVAHRDVFARHPPTQEPNSEVLRESEFIERAFGTSSLRILGPLEFLTGTKSLTANLCTPKIATLLAVLVARGSTGVSAAELESLLWSDHDLVAPDKALEISILRLRRVLANERLVLVRGGTVRLNLSLLSTDFWELELMHHRLLSMELEKPSAAEFNHLKTTFLHLDRGAPFEGIDHPALDEARWLCEWRLAECRRIFSLGLPRGVAAPPAEDSWLSMLHSNARCM